MFFFQAEAGIRDRNVTGVQTCALPISQTRYQGFMALDAVELQFRRFAGDWSPIMERELLRRQEAAGVLIWDPKRDELLFIEQFRIGALEDERSPRSEEHTSELQSRFDLVCRLLLEKKKMNIS